jgi:hypothetical protein
VETLKGNAVTFKVTVETLLGIAVTFKVTVETLFVTLPATKPAITFL